MIYIKMFSLTVFNEAFSARSGLYLMRYRYSRSAGLILNAIIQVSDMLAVKKTSAGIGKKLFLVSLSQTKEGSRPIFLSFFFNLNVCFLSRPYFFLACQNIGHVGRKRNQKADNNSSNCIDVVFNFLSVCNKNIERVET